jgi:hypothetical protein
MVRPAAAIRLSDSATSIVGEAPSATAIARSSVSMGAVLDTPGGVSGTVCACAIDAQDAAASKAATNLFILLDPDESNQPVFNRRAASICQAIGGRISRRIRSSGNLVATRTSRSRVGATNKGDDAVNSGNDVAGAWQVAC